jgi:glycerol-3-phosphate O-acyltransferase/dihydroxyacetone phosphate acyltransferase
VTARVLKCALMRLYRMVVRLLRLAMSVFFRQVSVVGLENIPAHGAVIFAGNHPNSLLDPVLIVTTCVRPVHFAAKDVLFQSRVLRPILDALGCVPVARRVEHGDGADNSAAFSALQDALRSGGAMGIFPEGISHHGAELSRLKTGAARIALGTVETDAAQTISIVPCGLTYVHRKRFRSRVLVQYGPPIIVDSSSYPGPEGPRTLTTEIEQGMRALTINAPDWETVRVLDAVRRLYQPPSISLADRVELARRFTAHWAPLREVPEIRGLFERVLLFLDRLEVAGLTDRDLRSAHPTPQWRRVLLNLWLILVWLPLGAPGLVLHLPLGLLASWGAHRLTPRKDVLGTTKLLLGLGVILLLYVALVATAAVIYGWPGGLLVAVLLPASGYATLRVLERGGSLWRLATKGWRSVRLGDELAALRAEADQLERAVVDIVSKHRPAELDLMFPREPAVEANT